MTASATAPRLWDRPLVDFPNLLHLAPPICHPDDSVEAVIAVFSADPGARSVFVVDTGDHILGAIPERILDRDLMTMVLPQELWSSVGDLDTRELMRFAKGSFRRARDLMSSARSVSASSRLRDAVSVMGRHGEAVVALVDDDHRLIGYLTMFEVLAELMAGQPHIPS